MIMLVEDNDSLRYITEDFIRSLGYEVAAFASAEAAMPALVSLPIEVLVTDLGLPGTKGEVLAAEACTLRPSLQVIFLTGNPEFPNGGSDGTSPIVIRKPYDFDALEIALGQRRNLVPAMGQKPQLESF